MFVKNPYKKLYYNVRRIKQFEICKRSDNCDYIVLDMEGQEYSEIIEFKTKEDCITFVRALLAGY